MTNEEINRAYEKELENYRARNKMSHLEEAIADIFWQSACAWMQEQQSKKCCENCSLYSESNCNNNFCRTISREYSDILCRSWQAKESEK